MDATGYKGFYYHFLDMTTGKRAWNCELSTVDTTFLLAGMLTAASLFHERGGGRLEIRTLVDELYRRVDWQLGTCRMAGRRSPMGGNLKADFMPYRWQGFDEALLLYLLDTGFSDAPIAPGELRRPGPPAYQWRKVYDHARFLYAGPLFIHQLSHGWVDFRAIQDTFMHWSRSIDYFENSRRATYVQQQYAIHNPEGNSSTMVQNAGGSRPAMAPATTLQIKGKERRFFGYLARGVPDGPDDGTISPWAAVASLPRRRLCSPFSIASTS